MRQTARTQGFTIIELLLVVVGICIVAGLISLTLNSVQTKNRNGDRQADIDSLRIQLESYFSSTDTYPTLAALNDRAWRQQNLPHLKDSTLDDPRWHAELACSNDGKALLWAEPIPGCYGYQVTGPDGTTCDNDKVVCAHYTLTASLENGEKYTKPSLN